MHAHRTCLGSTGPGSGLHDSWSCRRFAPPFCLLALAKTPVHLFVQISTSLLVFHWKLLSTKIVAAAAFNHHKFWENFQLCKCFQLSEIEKMILKMISKNELIKQIWYHKRGHKRKKDWSGTPPAYPCQRNQIWIFFSSSNEATASLFPKKKK